MTGLVRKRRAFTLIELMVVVMIISLLFVLFLNSSVGLSDITDGASNTLLAGETVDFSLGWASGTRATLRNTSLVINSTFLHRNKDFPLGRTRTLVSGPEALFVGGFSSLHSNGAQFVFCDGRVLMLNDSMSPTLLSHLGNRHAGGIVTHY